MKNIFPIAVDPPKLVKPYGPTLGYVAAGILIIFVLVHLFRIDTLMPIVDKVLPGDLASTSAFVIAVLLAEVFALPFLLRMKLSPLAHLFSGFLAILAPLLWTLLAVWSLGLPDSTGQLGEFVDLPASMVLIFANVVWLIFNFITVWTLGYNNLKIKEALNSIRVKKAPKPAKS